MRDVDLGEPTSFLDHVYWGCTQRECQLSKDGVGKIALFRKSEANISSWSYDMEGHAKKCVERYCKLANKTTQQLYKVATPCMDDHQLKEDEIESVGELSTVCSPIVLKCLFLARIGRADILWSVNKLARAVTKWSFDLVHSSHM